MKIFNAYFFVLAFFSKNYCCSEDMLASCHQLLIVTSSDWKEKQGILQLYERADDDSFWTLVGTPIPVILGGEGLAWGIGLHPANGEISSQKKEGDKKSPAGIFSIGTVFGFTPYSQMNHLKIEYLYIDEYIEAIDDPLSHYYNHIVSNKEISRDWHSSEKMSEQPLYKIGFVINHNFPDPKAGAGSAIFFHIWPQHNFGTEGCTTVSEENLTTILSWLERNKNPILVQLPIFKYHELQNDWGLPGLPSEPTTIENLSSETQ